MKILYHVHITNLSSGLQRHQKQRPCSIRVCLRLRIGSLLLTKTETLPSRESNSHAQEASSPRCCVSQIARIHSVHVNESRGPLSYSSLEASLCRNGSAPGTRPSARAEMRESATVPELLLAVSHLNAQGDKNIAFPHSALIEFSF
jgi:hypothetical protein